MDGELTPDLEGALRAHLETCGGCQAISEEYTRLDNTLRALVLDPDAGKRVAEHALAMSVPRNVTVSSRQQSAPPSNHSKVLAAAAATLSMAAAILALVWFTGPEQVRLANQVEITLARGRVNVLPPQSTEWQLLSLPTNAMQLVGFQLQTEAAGLCEFRCPSGGVVRVDEQSELQVTSPTVISLTQGRIWCNAPAESALTVVPSPRVFTASMAMTCQPAAEMQATITNAEPVRVIAARGPVRVVDAKNSVTLQSGTLVRHSPEGWSEPMHVDALQATEWMLPLLALRGGKDPEFSGQVTGLLSRLGMSKLDYVREERLVDLGSPAAVPLIAYLRETSSSSDASKRRRAARIIAQTAPEDSVPDLIELLSDPLPDVRINAAQALERLTGLDHGLPPPKWKDEGEPQKVALARWRNWLRRR
jgi:hypothetical protein